MVFVGVTICSFDKSFFERELIALIMVCWYLLTQIVIVRIQIIFSVGNGILLKSKEFHKLFMETRNALWSQKLMLWLK